MKTTRKTLPIMLALSMLVAAGAGCGNSGSTTAADTTAAQQENDAADDNSAAGNDAAAENNTAASDNTSSGDKKSITVWAPEEIVELTQTKLDAWLAGQADWNGKYSITVSAMGEGDAATQMLTDVEAGADVFGFASDQLARLVSAGALSKPGGTFLEHVQNNNDSGAVAAVNVGGEVYAYPETSDNTYFLYYDKSVVTDPSTLEGVLDQCSAAGKKLYMDIQSGWYDVSFFFGAGADCYYTTDSEGVFTDAYCDYTGDAGLKAMKAMVSMAAHPGFGQLPDGAAAYFNPDGGTAGALVSGTWDSSTVSGYLGDNMGVCKMPTFTVDGETFQMGGFGSFKLVGVKPQTDSDKLTFCHLVADYITGEEMQLARFESNGWGPSNKAAQQADEVKADAVISAVGDQMQYCKVQGQYPNDYWTVTTSFGTDINAGTYTNADDDTLKAALQQLTDSILAAR